MDWSQITDQGLAFAVIAAIALAVIRGDLVLGREYRREVEKGEQIAERAEAATKELAESQRSERERLLAMLDEANRKVGSS